VHLVWFKRDLRIRDHRPLVEACERGDVLCLYVHEPELLGTPGHGALQVGFINESLEELRQSLRALGGELTVRVGSMPEVLGAIHREHGITALYSHRETGNRIAYERDLRVAAWAEEAGIAWHEWNQFGVVRRLKSRDGWAARWARFMSKPILDPPSSIRRYSGIDPGELPSSEELGLEPAPQTQVQQGGESHAHQTLDSFLESRGAGYRYEMSSPVLAGDSCSRLSPYFAFGNISVRTVYQRTRARSAEIKALRKEGADLDPRWLRSLSSFQSRLRWHCHFMQKLEDEPELEQHALNRALDGLREADFRQDYFDAWATGQTGYPLVDACMRALLHTGWINFRMRAMLMSFASYHLWLPWRPTALHLAEHFLDFEPGIHFSQAQMQSGVTGINAIRIYSPIKQVLDQDPEGIFIKQYVPELAGVPAEHIAQPHEMPLELQDSIGCVIGVDYPAPIVEHGPAYSEARRRIYAARRTPEARAESERVYQKHGSRKRPRRAAAKGQPKAKPRRGSAGRASSRTR
jgi:deoxyribodipyrimidine photo-lyase